MPISVRRISYESDSQTLVDLLQANLPYRSHAQFFPWLYCANPEGQALAWVAVDSGSGRMVGAASAFPRRMYVSGAEARGFVLGDFCVSQDCRSLGLAVMLQRACLEGVSASGAALAFDLPSSSMLAVYKRLRIAPGANMVRHAKPLRVDKHVTQRVPVPAVAKGISTVANAALRLQDVASQRHECAIALEAGPCGHEFTAIGKEWSRNVGICVARTAEYLNWRYAKHPQTRYEMLSARKNGELRGYLVLHMDQENCTVDDLVASDDSVAGALLAEVTVRARERGAHTVSAPWLSSSSTRPLETRGFRPRESQPVVLLNLPLQDNAPTTHWHLSNGDWDN
jgi:hypothetical protein